jgi:hypothetical protein
MIMMKTTTTITTPTQCDSAISGSTGSTNADDDPIHPSQCKQQQQ